jgi:hypothetical protein
MTPHLGHVHRVVRHTGFPTRVPVAPSSAHLLGVAPGGQELLQRAHNRDGRQAWEAVANLCANAGKHPKPPKEVARGHGLPDAKVRDRLARRRNFLQKDKQGSLAGGQRTAKGETLARALLGKRGGGPGQKTTAPARRVAPPPPTRPPRRKAEADHQERQFAVGQGDGEVGTGPVRDSFG